MDLPPQKFDGGETLCRRAREPVAERRTRSLLFGERRDPHDALKFG
jgi:hypothetical protein